MINPWVILGVLIFWAASVGGAYYKGSQHAQDKARAEYSGQLEATIAEHNANALIDTEAAVEAAKREVLARGRASTVRSVANEAIRAHPLAAVCNWNDATFAGLLDAVNNANGIDLEKAVKSSNRTP